MRQSRGIVIVNIRNNRLMRSWYNVNINFTVVDRTQTVIFAETRQLPGLLPDARINVTRVAARSTDAGL